MFKTLLQIYLGLTLLITKSYNAELPSSDLNMPTINRLDQLIKEFAATTLASPHSSRLNQQEEGDDSHTPLQIIRQQVLPTEKMSSNFNQMTLISFIEEQKRIDKRQFDERQFISAEHLKTIDTLITLDLENLCHDLHTALRNQNNDSYLNLTNIQTLTTHHKNILQKITESVPPSNSPDEHLIKDLIFCYYSLSLSKVIYSYCKPHAEDAKEMWEKKATIFIMNIKTHLNQYETIFPKNAQPSILIQSIQTILEPTLLNFFNESCQHIKHCYEYNRSTFTKGLKRLGIRESDTEKKFKQFIQDYLLHFAFLKGISVTSPQEVQEHFLRVDNTFGESVAMFGNLWNWNTPSSATEKKISVIKGKASNSKWTLWQ